tara:strand:- start:48 stop:452 length:405 start_codon:yes stop_codon:yes gene_type:complete
MKKPKQDKFPFIKDKTHIYNKLIDKEVKEVNVGWAVFEFELHSNLCSDEQKIDGMTEWDSKKIKLEMNLSDLDARETIIHEIYHCMLESAGLDEKNFDSQRMFLANEQLVIVLSKQTMLIHLLNPGLYSILYND